MIKIVDSDQWLSFTRSKRRQKYELSQEQLERIETLFGQRLDAWQTVERIVSQVELDGDKALIELTKALDGYDPNPFEVDINTVSDIAASLSQESIEAIESCAESIRAFHEYQFWQAKQGTDQAYLRAMPFRRIVAYVPGGRTVYPSSVLMNCIPARIAGVNEVFLTTPGISGSGDLPTLICAAAKVANVDKVFRLGGAQAIAGFAYGTESIPRVDFICGPGNVFVTLAKKMVYGDVGIDSLAGPSEAMVVADPSQDPYIVAVDLLAQLEHDPDSWAVLIAFSKDFVSQVEDQLERVAAELDEVSVVDNAYQRGHLLAVIISDVKNLPDIVNPFAPEHLEVLLKELPFEILDNLYAVGAVFIGYFSPVPIGDYAAGPNHVLPTAGSARFGSLLNVHSFIKRTSVIMLERNTFEKLAPAAITLANLEGFKAHAHAIKVRV